jgi:hypothetical protein
MKDLALRRSSWVTRRATPRLAREGIADFIPGFVLLDEIGQGARDRLVELRVAERVESGERRRSGQRAQPRAWRTA